jgi:hypothetical protein
MTPRMLKDRAAARRCLADGDGPQGLGTGSRVDSG